MGVPDVLEWRGWTDYQTSYFELFSLWVFTIFLIQLMYLICLCLYDHRTHVYLCLFICNNFSSPWCFSQYKDSRSSILLRKCSKTLRSSLFGLSPQKKRFKENWGWLCPSKKNNSQLKNVTWISFGQSLGVGMLIGSKDIMMERRRKIFNGFINQESPAVLDQFNLFSLLHSSCSRVEG